VQVREMACTHVRAVPQSFLAALPNRQGHHQSDSSLQDGWKNGKNLP